MPPVYRFGNAISAQFRLRRARLERLASGGCSRARSRTRSSASTPAALRRGGSGFALPIALAVLAASGQIPRERLREHASLGELALDGRVRPVGGVLAAAEAARGAGLTRLLCSARSAPEAALAGVDPVPLRHLAEAAAYLRGEADPEPFVARNGRRPEEALSDLADVRGQERARRALEIAAAGRHNLLFGGPPGTGKTMLARRLPGVLPPLTTGEALEVTRIHSVAAMNLCPCGARGDPAAECSCSPQRLATYRDKLSRALLDRFDLVVAVPRPRAGELAADGAEA